MQGRYSISPGSSVTLIGCTSLEYGVAFTSGRSGSHVAKGTGSAPSSRTNFNPPRPPPPPPSSPSRTQTPVSSTRSPTPA